MVDHELIEQVRRLQAERDALRAANATLARVVNGQPLPPDHVAVPRALLVRAMKAMAREVVGTSHPADELRALLEGR